MARVAVFGSGAWGTALAAHAARMGHDVRLWALEPQVVEQITIDHENRAYLPGITLPARVSATSEPEEALLNAELVILVPPSQHLRSVASQLRGHIGGNAVVAVATKGVEESTTKLMSDVLDDTLPEVTHDRLCVPLGPSFAIEVARGLPTNVVVASHAPAAARGVQRLLHAPHFRVYTGADPIGVQVGGASKNVIAVAAGIRDGLDLRHERAGVARNPGPR